MIGEYIKKFRDKKGWTQNDLAEKSGVSRVSIGNYERGDRSPTLETLQKIASALNMPANCFVDGSEYRQLVRADVSDHTGDGLLAYLHHLNCGSNFTTVNGKDGYYIIMKNELKSIFLDFETLDKIETLVEADIKKMIIAFGTMPNGNSED